MNWKGFEGKRWGLMELLLATSVVGSNEKNTINLSQDSR
jgi:hypothetical protein